MRLVFIDETWANTDMDRPRGRSPRGRRLCAAVPQAHWKISTFVAALPSQGMTTVIDCAINGIIFGTYVEKLLAPTLAEGDIIIVDNRAPHKVAEVCEAMTRGARALYLPAYSS